jgi:hypothetical protein
MIEPLPPIADDLRISESLHRSEDETNMTAAKEIKRIVA